MMTSNNKINVLLLTDCLADLMGGAERQIYELAKGLDKGRYNVTIASLECVGQAPRHLIEAIHCRFVGFRVKRIYGLSGLIQGIRFWRYLRRERIDIIQTYHFSSDIWGTVVARLAGVKYIISNRRDMGFWRSQRHIITYKWVNRWVNKIVAVSESIKRLVMSEENVPEEQIAVIYNGIAMDQKIGINEKDFIRRETGVSDDDVVIMHVANFTPVKGHAYLINAMAGVVAEYPKAKLVLIGEGLLYERLIGLVEQNNLKKQVVFLGKRADARRLLTIADICVLPSVSEGMSNAILEYMAASKPVVATRVGGNPELVVDGKTGILVDKENSTRIKEALLPLIQDGTMRHQMGKAGLKRIMDRFQMPNMIAAYDHLFATAVPMDNIRVCHLVSSGGLFGAEQVILNLAKSDPMYSYVGAIRNSHNPHLEVIEAGKKMGLNTVVFDSKGRFDFRTALRVRRFIKEKRIDILHTHNYKSDVVGFLATRFAMTNWVATNHVWHGLDRKLRLYEHLDAFLLRFARRVVAVSDEIKTQLKDKHIPVKKVHVIDNGVEVGLYDQKQPEERVKKDLGINNGETVVSIVGRLSPEKGHATFLKAAREVLSRDQGVKFLIIGDGPIKDELQSEASNLQLNGNVIFTGVRDDMPAMYAASDILVNASSIEGLPMTILEAMAAKVALIVTPVGAVSKVIKDGVNGYLVNEGDYRNLADKICALIKHPEQKEDIVNRAYRDVCDKFSSHTMAQRYGVLYNGLLD
jgi:glycosyltransferase involved in cell wall biosynthesis